ncbi:ATP-dependent Clp protease ATP-binding subunit [Candidatus Berkelbacteria bacterium]|nr:ATP-dependent Clp protease ATP-binding subunit [Candidatus Berkelbacteria bacterium]
MIRFEGALGIELARLQIHLESKSAVMLRSLIIAGASFALLYLCLTLFNLIPVWPTLFGFVELGFGIGFLWGMRELYLTWVLHHTLPSVALALRTQHPDWLTTTNFLDYVSPELGRIFLRARTEAGVQVDTLIKASLTEPVINSLLARAGFLTPLATETETTSAPKLPEPITAPDALLAYAAQEAIVLKQAVIDVNHFLYVLAEHYQPVADRLFAHNLELNDLAEAIAWYERHRHRVQRRFFWERGKVGIYGIGRDWSAGYTPTLSHFSIDLARYLQDADLQTQIVGREQVIDQIEQILASETRTNVLLVGRVGVGKRTVVNGLAARIASGEVSRSLANKHVLELDVAQVLAGLGDRGAIEFRLMRVLRDAERAGNIILFVNNIHTLLSSAYGKVGSINAGEVLAPFLRSGRIQLIAATTPMDYHAIIEAQGTVRDSFRRIEVQEPAPTEAVILAEDVALHLEARHGVFIALPVIKKAVEFGHRYVQGAPLPESALTLLEAAAIRASNEQRELVTFEDIDVVVSEQTRVPVGEVQMSEKARLLNLEDVLHDRVIGQDEAIVAVASALRRARSGLGTGKRPIGSFLFLGPTGVGKTETARALAETYFGSEKSMVRLDMSEFQSPASLARLIGAPTEAQQAGSGQLTSAIKDAPFSLILLDEVEKSHPNILNVFLQILDDGRVTDGRGETVDFTNAIIIATSNAGSEFIRSHIQAGENMEQLRDELLNALQSQGLFKPEFLNRFDAVVAFKPLLPDQLMQIVDLQLKGLNARLAEQDVQISLTEAAKKRLAELGYQPEFGARALRRVMQDRVENMIASRLLAGEIKRGQTLAIDASDLE